MKKERDRLSEQLDYSIVVSTRVERNVNRQTPNSTFVCPCLARQRVNTHTMIVPRRPQATPHPHHDSDLQVPTLQYLKCLHFVKINKPLAFLAFTMIYD